MAEADQNAPGAIAISESPRACSPQASRMRRRSRRLRAPAEPILSYTITQQDVAGPFIGTMPEDMMGAPSCPRSAYTTALEALAEKFHCSPALLRSLNPGAKWGAGEVIKVPDVEPFELPSERRVQSRAGRHRGRHLTARQSRSS